MNRDPRTDPQPGDEIRLQGSIRRVTWRRGERLRCQSGAMRFPLSLRSWQEWCRKTDPAVQAAENEGVK
jgi:hypothetical protein